MQLNDDPAKRTRDASRYSEQNSLFTGQATDRVDATSARQHGQLSSARLVAGAVGLSGSPFAVVEVGRHRMLAFAHLLSGDDAFDLAMG